MIGPGGWRRLRSPAWLLSQARDLGVELHTALSGGDFARHYRAIRPYTMCGAARLLGLHRAVEAVVARGIPGSVVECGAARGGSAALMGLALKRLGERRLLWVFDTFEGLPPPTEADADWEIARLYTGSCRSTREEVEALFEQLSILGETRLVKGLFQDTLPHVDPGAIALLHIDCDWYEGVRVCLDSLYDRVSPGGVIQFDDYGHWAGARAAVEAFFHRRGIEPCLRRLDYTGRQMTKPAPAASAAACL